MLSQFKTFIRWKMREEPESLMVLALCKFVLNFRSAAYTLRYWGKRKESRAALHEIGKNRAKNAFVFANGPSIGDLDFEKVKLLLDEGNIDLISVNSFASKGINRFGVIPKFSVFADPSHYRIPGDPKYSLQSENDIASMNEHGVPALVPFRYCSRSKFVKTIPYHGFSNPFSKNVTCIDKPYGVFSITAFNALIAAIYFGYEKIYICGFDNSYFRSFCVDEKNRQFLKDEHFYAGKKDDIRYMDPDKFGPTSHSFYNTYRHFKFLEKIAKHNKEGVQIYNVAKTTYTDAFARDFSLDIYKDDSSAG